MSVANKDLQENSFLDHYSLANARQCSCVHQSFCLSVCLSDWLSVCLSVCLSVTYTWYCVLMNQATIMKSSPSDSPVIFVFREVRFVWKFGQNHTEQGLQIRLG